MGLGDGAAGWLVLPDLARQLTTNEAEREAVFALLDQGASEARRLLAAEGDGADRDVVVAISLCASQLWAVARQVEPPESDVDAFHAQVAAVLDSVKPAEGQPPHPAGGFFAPADLMGNWRQSSSAFGGFYVNAATGAAAGAAVHSSGGTFRLGTDGTYEYAFAFSSYNPQLGKTSGSERHEGRYRLDGDVVLVEPTRPLRSPFTCCAVGIGTRRTPEGVKRLLVTVSAQNDGTYRSAPIVPNWDGYDGVMSWYQEQ